ncbi:MAG TPA: hypothetical protein VFO76_06380, partial [Candidatus Kapabacteria bacterium]|nr:hypothetical protein [Candidatus Kapabacteria bacterium]
MIPASKPRTILGEFTPVEFVFLAFIAIMAIISIINFNTVDLSRILINLGTMILVIFAVNWLSNTSDAKWIRFLHSFYVVPLVLFVFKTVEKISYPIHGHDFDEVLINIDRSLLGTDATTWLTAHFPVTPIITELLVICYFSYYFLPVAIAIELFMRRHNTPDEDHSNDDLEQFRFIIIYSLLGSYICYLLMPGVGPRFTLHEFSNYSNELPGVWLTDGIRWLINLGENITGTMTT